MLTGVMGAADFGEGRLEKGKLPAHEAVKAALAAGHATWATACRRASGRVASSITSATPASADTRFRAAPPAQQLVRRPIAISRVIRRMRGYAARQLHQAHPPEPRRIRRLLARGRGITQPR